MSRPPSKITGISLPQVKDVSAGGNQGVDINPAPIASGEAVNVSVRQIENGYVTSESRWKDDDCTNKETFSKKPPKINVQTDD